MHCPSTGPKRSLLVRPSQSHQSPRISFQLVAATWGTEQRKKQFNPGESDFQIWSSNPSEQTSCICSRKFIALNFHMVETSTTLRLAKEFIADYWDKANYWNTSLGEPWQRQEPSISSTWQPAHWHVTWLSTLDRQHLVIATMLHAIKHCYWAEGRQREALWRLFKSMPKSHFIWSSHGAWSLTSPMARPSRARAWKSWFSSSIDRTCEQTKQ